MDSTLSSQQLATGLLSLALPIVTLVVYMVVRRHGPPIAEDVRDSSSQMWEWLATRGASWDQSGFRNPLLFRADMVLKDLDLLSPDEQEGVIQMLENAVADALAARGAPTGVEG